MDAKSIFKINGIITVSTREKFHSETEKQMTCQKLITVVAASDLACVSLLKNFFKLIIKL